MKDYSTMTNVDFWFDIIWKSIICLICYKELLFRPLPYHGEYYSIKILVQMIFLSMLFFIVVLQRWKNIWTEWACIILPYGFYTCRVYELIFGTFIRSVLITTIILSLVYAILVLTHRVHSKRKKTRAIVYLNRIFRCIYSISCILAVAMIVIMARTTYGTYLKKQVKLSAAKDDTAVVYYEREDLIESNIEMVSKLNPDIWEDLSADKKLDVLQTICNIETKYLGICDPILVQGEDLPELLGGTYSDSEKLIRIKSSEIEDESVENILHILFHEIYHSYEHRLIDVYNGVSSEQRRLRLFMDIHRYSQENENYIDVYEDIYEYLTQRLEIECDNYAEATINEYSSYIE